MNTLQRIISFQERLQLYYNLLSDKRSHFYAESDVDKNMLKNMAVAAKVMLEYFERSFNTEISEYRKHFPRPKYLIYPKNSYGEN